MLEGKISRIRRSAAQGALILLALALCAGSLSAQVIEVIRPDPAKVAAAQRNLQRIEADFARRLERTEGDLQVGKQLGEALRAPVFASLDHPSPSLRAAIAAARDPAALALAIAGSGPGKATYEIDVLLTALSLPSSRPRRTTLWAAAAVVEGAAAPRRLVFLERAYDGVAGGPGGLSTTAVPAACALAAWRLEEMLGAGLAHEAVATFGSLPAVLRERIEAAACPDLPGGAIDGVRIGPYHGDQRLSLVAARILEGDRDGARALLARIPGAAWRPGDPDLPGSNHPDPAAVWRAVIERWLVATPVGDAFPLLSEFAVTDGRRFGDLSVTTYARLAEREGYPAFAAYAWSWIPKALDGAPDPSPLPTAALRTLHRWQAAIAEQARIATAGAARQLGFAAARRPAVAITQENGEPLDLADHIVLMALDHEGRQGIVLRDNLPYSWDRYRIELRGGRLVAVRVEGWIA